MTTRKQLDALKKARKKWKSMSSKSRKIRNPGTKVGIITKMPREKFFMSFGYKPTEAKKTVRGYNVSKEKYGFARVLTRKQYNELRNRGKTKTITKSYIKKLVKK